MISAIFSRNDCINTQKFATEPGIVKNAAMCLGNEKYYEL